MMTPAPEVAFELECFEWADGRLELAGRWQGVTERRLGRPVLTVTLDTGRRKRLVALPGGHFDADGELWHAAFAWAADPAEIGHAELEAGRALVVDLPPPDRRRRRRRRGADAGEEATRAEVAALRAQVERLRAELAAREQELIELRSARPVVADTAPPEAGTTELAAAEPVAPRRLGRLGGVGRRSRSSPAGAVGAEGADGAYATDGGDGATAAWMPPDTGAEAVLQRNGPDPAGVQRNGPDPAGVQRNGPDPGAQAATEAGVEAGMQRNGPDPAGMQRNGSDPVGARPDLVGPRRSAAAARARAEATVAARRRPAEVWGLRVLAATVVVVLLAALVALLLTLV